MPDKVRAAAQLRRAIQVFAASLDEEAALEIPAVYPFWMADVSYAAGDYLTYGVNGVGDPQLYRVAQAHVSQEDWLPDKLPALYTPLGLNSEGYPIWSQPAGVHDAYSLGDVVDYRGGLYRCTVDGNVWAPDAYPQGWESYKEE